MIFISAINTSLLQKFIIPCFVVSLVLLAFVPIIGVEVKGAKDGWISTCLDFSQSKF